MRALMMDRPLLVSSLIEHAARYHADTEIVSRTAEGSIHRYGYAEAERRAKRLAKALRRLGVAEGDRVATLAWNGYRHFEIYYGVAGIGAVCHTVNPRLFEGQLRFIVNHAGDRILFLDPGFLPLVERLAADWRPVEHYVVMADRAHIPQSALANLLCYEELVAAETAELDWPELDENTASALCYTSGTTGNPKGALYSHRSTVLHAYACCAASTTAISLADSVCPVVPMFHVNAWGIPYAAAMAGAKLVLPGPRLDGASLHALFKAEGVTIGLGVPTVWLGLLKYLAESGQRIDFMDRILIGGSAAPLAMVKAFEETHGVRALHGWGMTEMSPVGTVSRVKPKAAALPAAAQYAIKVKQGLPLFGVEMRIVDAEGRMLPHDGAARGELQVRGPWIIAAYYGDDAASQAAAAEGGWFRTGDVATIDADGYMQVVDRSKDVIKSGGEWISSIDIENAAIGHEDVAEAAVIGMPHRKWGERPLLIIVPKEGRVPDKDAILGFLAPRLARWALPDDVAFVAEIPHSATGKILKTRLREIFCDYRLPAS